jgi:hypothetical protein
MEKIFFKCEGHIATDRWNPHKCGQKASVEREGKWYCKRHDPVAMKAKRDAKDKIYDERFKNEMARIRRTNAAVACVDNLVKAVKLVLALNQMPPVKTCMEAGGAEYIVRLDPKAREQLENAVKTYENTLKG